MSPFLTRQPQPYRPRAADLLEEFIQTTEHEKLSLEHLMSALGHRAFGVAILVFALANILIANIPGISTILSIPLMIFSLQMMWGVHHPWLPKKLAQREFDRATFERMLRRAAGVMRKIEVFIKPRLLFLVIKNDKVLGFICLLLSIVLALPILFGNWLPAWGLVFISLAMIERDGLLILIGLLFGVAAVAYAIAFYSGFAYLMKWLVQYGW